MANATLPVGSRKCHPDIQHEVDGLILDYVAYNAIKLIEELPLPTAANGTRLSYQGFRQRMPDNIADSVGVVQSYMQSMGKDFESEDIESPVKFRLRLLKFLVIFRFKAADHNDQLASDFLGDLRRQNRDRTKAWYENAQREILPDSVKDWYSNFTSEAIYLKSKYESSNDVPILDQLPFFISLLAYRSSFGQMPLSQQCLKLVAQFALQTILEQYVHIGIRGIEPISNAFAWGYEGVRGVSLDILGEFHHETKVAQESHSSGKILQIPKQNIAFKDTDENLNGCFCTLEPISLTSAKSDRSLDKPYSLFVAHPLEPWVNIRSSSIMRLLPVSKGDTEPRTTFDKDLLYPNQKGNYHDTLNHLHSLYWDNPVEKFSKEVISLVCAMNRSTAMPVLTQLEVQSSPTSTSKFNLEIADGVNTISIPPEEAEVLRNLARELN